MVETKNLQMSEVASDAHGRDGGARESVTNGSKNATSDGVGMSFINVLHISFFLIGPLLMGMAINSLGNERPIRSHFAWRHGYTTQHNSPDSFPPDLWSLGFLYPFGGLFGSLLGAFLVEKIGRKSSTLIFCGVMILGGLCKIVSRYTDVWTLFFSRFLDGVATAGFMVSAVLLMLECLTVKLEYIFKPLVQMSVNLGILLMGVLALDDVGGNEWNLIHIVTVIFAVILGIATILHPESPKYVYSKRRNSNATREIFKRLRGGKCSEEEFERLKTSVNESSFCQKLTFMEFLKNRSFTGAILSTVFLHIGQQLSGINAIMAFAPSLLRTAGFGSGDTGGTIIFAVAVLGSMLFAPIIETKPRKFLWLLGFLVMNISFCLLVICSYAEAPSEIQIVWLCLFVFIFQLGPGPVVWFISLEVFPPQAIGAAQGICGSFNWLANTLVYFLFPIVQARIGISVLFIFIAFELLIIIYSVFFVIETYGRTSAEVLKDYEKIYKFLPNKKIEVLSRSGNARNEA